MTNKLSQYIHGERQKDTILIQTLSMEAMRKVGPYNSNTTTLAESRQLLL